MPLQIPKRAWWRQLTLAFALIFTLLITSSPLVANASALHSPYHNDGVYYWVQPGDTLSEIAVWHGTSVWALMQANGLADPNHIYVGQKLYIPNSYGGHHGGGHHGGPTCAFYHTVQHGQTLSHIAVYYGVNVHTLAQINAIYNWNHVYAGQKLCVPGGYNPPPPPKPYPPKPEPPKPQPPAKCSYTVQYGDTLAKIAYW